MLKHADASKRSSYKKADDTIRLVNEKLLRGLPPKLLFIEPRMEGGGRNPATRGAEVEVWSENHGQTAGF